MLPAQKKIAPPVLHLWQDRTFLAAIAGAGMLRIAMALGFWALAVLISDNPPLEVVAFRLRAIDSLGYNQEALHILSYWNGTRDLYLQTLSFSFVVAILYKIFGNHPLVVSIFCSICYACVGLLAYGIASELGRQRWEARVLALLICLWPSSLVWSIAPLKEGPHLLAVFGLFFCWMRLLSGKRINAWQLLAIGLGLLVSVFWLVFLRFYVWYLLLALIPLTLLYQVLPPGPNQTRPGLKRILAVIVLLLGGLGLSQPFNQDNVLIINKVTKQSSSRHVIDAGLAGFNLIDSAHAADKDAANPATTKKVETLGLFEILIAKLSYIRRTSVRQGGSSLTPEALQGEEAVDLNKDFKTWQSAVGSSLMLIKAALRDIFLFPYPWEPWPGGRNWGPMQLLVAAQSLLWYLLLPGLAAGIIIGIRMRPAGTITLILWGLSLGLLLGVTILNRGALFRLRDMAILPMILLWHPWPYLKVWQSFKSRG